jgi:transcription-repair coupling factor (superfamily II helicase)
MEHWLPLFHGRLETLFDYVPGSPLLIEPLAEDAARERLAQIEDYYEARRQALGADASGAPYKPLPPDRLYLTETEWTARLAERPAARMTPFAVPESSTSAHARAATSPPSAPRREPTYSTRFRRTCTRCRPPESGW